MVWTISYVHVGKCPYLDTDGDATNWQAFFFK